MGGTIVSPEVDSLINPVADEGWRHAPSGHVAAPRSGS